MTALPATARSSSAPYDARLLSLVVVAIFAFGNFFPPETYFLPEDFSIGATENRTYGFQFARYAYLTLLLTNLVIVARYPRLMAGAFGLFVLPVAYALWLTFACSWSVDPGGSLTRSVRAAMLITFTGFMVARFEGAEVRRIVLICGAATILASIFAVLAFPSLGRTMLQGYEGAWRGSLIHKNSLGFVMAVVAVLCLHGIRSDDGNARFARLLFLPAIAVMLLSRSTTSLICFCVGAFILLSTLKIQGLRDLWARVVLLILLGQFVGLVVLLLSDPLIIPSITGKSMDFTGRTDIWAITAKLIDTRPVWGYGPGFWLVDHPVREATWAFLGFEPPHAHNTFLDVRLQLGLVGVAVVGGLYGHALLLGFRQIVAGRTPATSLWCAILAMLFVQGLSETNLIEPGGSGVFLITLVYGSIRRIERDRRRPTRFFSGARL